jgi:hypothetical protein
MLCGESQGVLTMLICDHCFKRWHMVCFTPPLVEVPIGEWFVHNAPSNLVLLFYVRPQYQNINMFFIRKMGYSRKVVIWLNLKNCSYLINDGAHIALILLISSCLEPNSFHGLPYHIMFHFIIIFGYMV